MNIEPFLLEEIEDMSKLQNVSVKDLYVGDVVVSLLTGSHEPIKEIQVLETDHETGEPTGYRIRMETYSLDLHPTSSLWIEKD